jgi:hypothetical protein
LLPSISEIEKLIKASLIFLGNGFKIFLIKFMNFSSNFIIANINIKPIKTIAPANSREAIIIIFELIENGIKNNKIDKNNNK